MKRPHLDFNAISVAVIAHLPCLVQVWLPGGKFRGLEYIARNPRRQDRNLGSFSINTANGKWCDFATGDRGSDPVSLYAYLRGIGQAKAARELARELGARRDY